MSHLWWLSLGLLGCSIQATKHICPNLAAGELVVTEMRGVQQGADSFGQWIELYDARTTGEPLNLRGLQLHLSAGDLTKEFRIIVRGDLESAPGDFIVLSNDEPSQPLPAFVDYSFFSDFFSVQTLEDDNGVAIREVVTPAVLKGKGILSVVACSDEPIDTLVFPNLPTEGTWALQGEPSSERNDHDDNFRVDDCAGRLPGFGLSGTPGEANPPECTGMTGNDAASASEGDSP